MKQVIVCSLNDPAGTNIRERLIELFNFRETFEFFDSYPVYLLEDIALICSRKDIVFVDGLEEKFGICNYYFISRHRAESKVPSLTAHFTGNFGENDFGGNPGEISCYAPSKLKNYLLYLNSMRADIPAQYTLTLEATHHGPTSLWSPVLFVELGSSSDQWCDTTAAKFVAVALMKSINDARKFDKCAIGVGGTHYSEKFNKLLINSEVALGPVVPKYSLQYFTSDLLNQMLAKSTEKVSFAAVDMKGLGRHKNSVLQVIHDSGLELIRA